MRSHKHTYTQTHREAQNTRTDTTHEYLPTLTRLRCAALFYTAINNSFAVYGRFAFADAGVLTALEEVTPSDPLCNNLQELVMDTNDLAIMLSRDAVTGALTAR